jgi:hypothetical protein
MHTVKSVQIYYDAFKCPQSLLECSTYNADQASHKSSVKLSRYTPWRHWGERRYSSYSFLTSALDWSEWSASRPGRALPLGKGPPVHIAQEAGRAPESVWTQGLEEKSSAPTQPVVRHYTDWATLALAKLLTQMLCHHNTLVHSIYPPRSLLQIM